MKRSKERKKARIESLCKRTDIPRNKNRWKIIQNLNMRVDNTKTINYNLHFQ